MENAKPKMPVIKLDNINVSEFFKNLSLTKIKPHLHQIISIYIYAFNLKSIISDKFYAILKLKII
ncbi:hypothetical protein CSCA_1328 [Clostridium scatologenes]|uniref:Uncharacterized protein n=1 Tax=Clostridium scatologenes TaxID=1548 RepID=A0A0E3M769_CLOSL|nr:hypothetical protein CSCA_1328 [Clostridium scatologenes]